MTNKNSDEFLERFVTEEVIETIERSTSYGRIIKSKDPEEFYDLGSRQWDLCTGSILCLLRQSFREEKLVPSQAVLVRICKLAARKIHKRHKLIMELESKTT